MHSQSCHHKHVPLGPKRGVALCGLYLRGAMQPFRQHSSALNIISLSEPQLRNCTKALPGQHHRMPLGKIELIYVLRGNLLYGGRITVQKLCTFGNFWLGGDSFVIGLPKTLVVPPPYGSVIVLYKPWDVLRIVIKDDEALCVVLRECMHRYVSDVDVEVLGAILSSSEIRVIQSMLVL